MVYLGPEKYYGNGFRLKTKDPAKEDWETVGRLIGKNLGDSMLVAHKRPTSAECRIAEANKKYTKLLKKGG